MTAIAPALNSETNIFQRYLISEDSNYVRILMQRASKHSESKNLFVSHFVSVAYAIVAVALSVFNVVSYLLGIPFKMLLNIASFNPIALITDFVGDLTNVARSILFVSLGTTFVIAGLLLPQEIFGCFAPDATLEEKRQGAFDALRKDLQEKDKSIGDLKNKLLIAKRTMQQQAKRINATTGELDTLKKSKLEKVYSYFLRIIIPFFKKFDGGIL